ncbi:mCG148274 [Mus musculus]|nr:mCG148274 [Mus musculus]
MHKHPPVSALVYVHVHVCVHVHVRLEVNAKCIPLLHSTLLCEMG